MALGSTRRSKTRTASPKRLAGVSVVAIGALLSTYAGALRNVGYAQTLGVLSDCSMGSTEVSSDDSLQSAILNSIDGDVICITADITVSQTLQIDDTTLTIEGSGNPTLSGGGARQIINADFTDNSSDDTLTLRNLGFAQGSAAAPGGAIDVLGQDYQDALIITGVTADNNAATGVSGRGGALAARELGRVEISASVFTDNTAQVTGGAVYLYRAGEVVMDGVDLQRNTTTASSGGALYIGAKAATEPQKLTITNSDFVDNTSNDQGGGAISVLYFDDTVSLSSVDFIRNMAIDTNATSADGGAIALRYMTGPVILSSVNAIDNRADQSGGFLYDDSIGTSREVSVAGLTSLRNHATGTGGSIHVGDGSLSVTDSTFTDDSAVSDGGQIYARTDSLDVVMSEFTGGSTTTGGGGISVNSARVTISGSTFSDNETLAGTSDGGALNMLRADGELKISSSTFVGNYSADDGGAIYAKADAMTISGSTFSLNSAQDFGGAIYAYKIAGQYIMTTDFELNSALGRSGGSLYLYSNDAVDDTTVLNQVTFTDDSAHQHGGSLVAYLNGPLTLSGVTANGSAANWSGGFGFVRTDDSTVARHDIRIYDSSFTGLRSLGVGADGDGGAFRIFDAHSLLVVGTTFSGSSADGDGGALVASDIGDFGVYNSTISGNSAGLLGGGMYLDVDRSIIEWATVSSNSAASGGGFAAPNSTAVVSSNTILSGNTATTSGADAYVNGTSTWTSTYSIFGSPSSVVGATINDDSNIFGDPKLNALADNGGPTLTRLPQWDSPVIGAGDPNWSGTPANDQRGAGFPRNAGGAVSIGAVQGSSAKPDPQPPTPVPPSAPLSVAGTARDGEATITWLPPASSGSFPVSTFQAVVSPGGQSCLSVSSPCVIAGLTNGTEYTVAVRALSGAGWGAFSATSAPFTPEEPPVEKSILITGTRGEVRGRPGVIVSGETTGLVGAQVAPWVKFPGQTSYAEGAARPTVDAQGDFTWQRRTGKKIYVYFRGIESDVKSNRVIIRAR